MYSGGGDAVADFSGGGFMPSQPSSSSFEKKSSGTPSTGLFPLTVKQLSRGIQTSVDDNLVVDGEDISNVTLVGMLSNKEERMTDISFVLDDGTGKVEVKRWIESPDAPEAIQLHEMAQGEYIRVHGHLRTFQNKKTIVAFSVRPVTDFNEITFHFLECISVHLHKNKAPQAGMAAASAPGFATTSTFPSNNRTAAGAAYNSGTYNQYVAPAATNTSGMDECQRRVQGVFEEPASLRIEQGLHFDEVVRKSIGFSRQQVRAAVDFLVNEGYIYSTIDDDHYKSTSA